MGNKPAYFKTKTAFEGGLNAVLFDWFYSSKAFFMAALAAFISLSAKE